MFDAKRVKMIRESLKYMTDRQLVSELNMAQLRAYASDTPDYLRGDLADVIRAYRDEIAMRADAKAAVAA